MAARGGRPSPAAAAGAAALSLIVALLGRGAEAIRRTAAGAAASPEGPLLPLADAGPAIAGGYGRLSPEPRGPEPREAALLPHAVAGDELVHGFCSAGLPYLVGLRAFDTLEHFVEICDDGPRLVVRALLQHGLAFELEEDHKEAVSLLASVASGLDDAGRGLLWESVALLRATAAEAAQPAVMKAAAQSLTTMAVKWGGAGSPLTARLLEDLAEDVGGRDGPAAGQGAMRILADLAVGLGSGRALEVLVRGAEESENDEVRVFATARLFQIAAKAEKVPEFALRCVEVACRRVVDDASNSVRYQAAYGLTELATQLRHEEAAAGVPAKCVAGLTDMSVRGEHPIDRQFAARGLKEIAEGSSSGALDKVTEGSIAALSALARDDEDSGVRAYAATLLEELALVGSPEEWPDAPQRCISALEDLAMRGHDLVDRRTGLQRLFDAAQALKAAGREALAAACVGALERLAKLGPDEEVRARAASLLDGLSSPCGEGASFGG